MAAKSSVRNKYMALHEDLARRQVPAGGSDRAFGIVFAVVFAGFSAWLAYGGNGAWPVALGAAAVFLAVAWRAPGALAPLNRLWTRFGLLIHRVVSPVVLGFLFFAVITPTGLVMRALGKDPLRLARDPAATSYWIRRQPPGPAPDTMRNQF